MHWQSVAAGVTVFLGYNSANALLAYWFYQHKAKDAAQWKIQPNKKDSGVGTPGWWFPVLDVIYGPVKARHPLHGIFASINITMASAMFAVAMEMIMSGRSQMRFDGTATPLIVAWELSVQLCGHMVAEYWWHRLMHTSAFYKRFHKYHHHNKAPEPFDDMLIHPLEAFGYYCILYSPPFLVPMHPASFAAYMVLMGVCGILDHSGVKARITPLYSSEDHDLHHALFDINYGFPFPWLDIVHGTYQGTYLGVQYDAKAKRRKAA